MTLGPKGGGFGGDLTSIGGRKECQQGRWVLKGWIVMSHIGWEGEDLGRSQGVDCDVPHRLGRRGFWGDPTSIGGRKECQRGRWVLNGVDCDIPP